MKTMTFYRWANIKELLNPHDAGFARLLSKEIGETIKVKVSFEYEPYRIKVIKGLNGCHIVDDGPDNRMPYDKFMGLIGNLRKGGQWEIAYDIYPGQSVTEFNWAEGTLGHKIKEIDPFVEVVYA